MNANWDSILWGLAWLAATLAVFALPLWPAWRELKTGSDAAPLAIDDADDGLTSYRARASARSLPWLSAVPPGDRWRRRSSRAVRTRDALTLRKGERAELLVSSAEIVLQPGSKITRTVHGRDLVSQGVQLPLRASADDLLVLEPGTRFFRISAPLIMTTPLPSFEPSETDALYTDVSAVGPRRFHKGDLRLNGGETSSTHLVVGGRLELGPQAVILGNVKAQGDVTLAPGARIEGALFTNGNVICQGDNRIDGPLCAGKTVELGSGFQGGRTRRPCSISGWQVVLKPSVRIFGSITAVTGGEVQA